MNLKNLCKVFSIIIFVICTQGILFADGTSAPIYYSPGTSENSAEIFVSPLDPPIYVGDTAPLVKYYDDAVMMYGYLNNYHEENYVYSNGSKENNIYNGVLSHMINDFDNDTVPELALLRIQTTGMGELAEKEIILEIIRLTNGVAALSESFVLDTQIFDGESIDVNFAYKKVNDEQYRFYYNYLEKKVLNNEYNNNFKAIDYPGNLVVVTETSYSGVEDDYDSDNDRYEFINQVLDSGLELKDDSDIHKRAFINDDANMKPLFTIKRINESMREGFIEDYMETHGEELAAQGFVRARYGYTVFTDRTT